MDRENLISDYMLKQNVLFHQKRQDYGTFGRKWAKGVTQLVKDNDIKTVLDYGAGKRSLEKSLPFPIQSYDPAISEISHSPEPTELVICTHVLEHIEPTLLKNLLDHINSLAKEMIFIVIDPGKSNKILPDGQDSNLIQESVDWWEKTLRHFFPSFIIQNIDRQAFIKQGKLIKSNSTEKGTFLGKKIQS